MIFYCTPYSLEKNLAKGYNEYVRRLTHKPYDWIFFIDGDACFLDPFWGDIINQAILKYPETGIFTCYTNRVGNTHQCFQNTMSTDPNILNHYKISQFLFKKNAYRIREHRRVVSGYFFGFSRATYDLVGGFPENRKILGVDTDFSHAVLKKGLKINIIEGLYIFHFYRMNSADPFHARAHLK